MQLEWRRRKAVALLSQGHRPARVAEMLGVSPASVTRWKQAYEKGGVDALAAKPHPGGKAKLTGSQWRRLERLLLKGPRYHGYPSDQWTLQSVAEVISAIFGVHYHPGHVWKLLRGMGWTCRKPERRGSQEDEQAIVRPRTTASREQPAEASYSSTEPG